MGHVSERIGSMYTHATYTHTHTYIHVERTRARANSRVGRRETRFGEKDFYGLGCGRAKDDLNP